MNRIALLTPKELSFLANIFFGFHFKIVLIFSFIFNSESNTAHRYLYACTNVSSQSASGYLRLMVWIYNVPPEDISSPSLTRSWVAEGAPFITVTFSFNTRPKSSGGSQPYFLCPTLRHNTDPLNI